MLSLHNVTQLLASRPPTRKGDSFLTMQPRAEVFPLPVSEGISLFLSGDLPEPQVYLHASTHALPAWAQGSPQSGGHLELTPQQSQGSPMLHTSFPRPPGTGRQGQPGMWQKREASCTPQTDPAPTHSAQGQGSNEVEPLSHTQGTPTLGVPPPHTRPGRQAYLVVMVLFRSCKASSRCCSSTTNLDRSSGVLRD